MNIAVGSDHRGIDCRKELIEFLSQYGATVVDCGPDDVESTDYPDYAEQVAIAVSAGKADRGVLICGTGVGMAITANKVKGIRAAVCNDVETAKLTRGHNNVNVLCLSANRWATDNPLEIVKEFLEAPFEGGRHKRRVDKIDDVGSRNAC